MGKIAIRYIVNDVDAAIPFYESLGFQVVMHPAPGFAALSLDGTRLLLNRPGAGGAGQTVSGHEPTPGGWNRMQVAVEDLPAVVARLKEAGCRFRSEIINGNGGRQILAEDPSGNPVELFEQYNGTNPAR